jgi:hypothetical protein
MPPGEVPVAPLRSAFLRSGVSAYEVAARLGWTRRGRYIGHEIPDTSRVKRTLGLKPYRTNGRNVVRQRVTYDRAVEVADAIGVDFHEVGV